MVCASSTTGIVEFGCTARFGRFLHDEGFSVNNRQLTISFTAAHASVSSDSNYAALRFLEFYFDVGLLFWFGAFTYF